MINKTDLFVSPLLTSHSIRYTQPAELYVCEKLAPMVKVNKDTGQIATYGMDNLRIAQSLRAQGAGTNEVNHSVTIGAHYILREHSLKELVTLEEMENADKPIMPKVDAVENLIDRMYVIKEKELADTMGNTSIITQNVTLSGTDQWNDYDNSDPIRVIQTAIDTVRSGSGRRANTLLFSYDVFAALIHHPSIVNRAQGAVVVTAAVATEVLMKAFPFIKQVMIGEAQYNSGVEGGTDTLADIWTKNAWALYIESNPRPKSRSFMYTYQKSASRVVDELPMGRSHETWDRKGDFVRVTDKYDQKLIDNKCCYLIKDAIA